MDARSSWRRGTWLAALAAGLLATSDAETRGAHGGGQKGHGSHAAHASAPRQTSRAPRMPHSSAPARMNVGAGQMGQTQARAYVNNSRPRASKARVHSGTSTTQARANNAQARTNTSQARANNALASSTSTSPLSSGSAVTPATMATVNARRSLNSSATPNTYTYGSGTGASRYRAYGYGQGYRNRYYGGRYGYGRSQGNNRAIVSRLRSVHASLARLDHDYQGHRARAMHSVSMAIRQLAHRSMGSNGAGSGTGMNNVGGAGMGIGRMNNVGGAGTRRSVLGGAGGGGGRMRLSQAQSDARMSQALRNLQGIGMQLANQGYNTTGQGRALGHVQSAAHELNVALSIR